MKIKTAQDRGVIEHGFAKAPDGWHVFEFLEGIDNLKNKEGVVITGKKGERAWKFPAKINDGDDEGNGIEMDQILYEGDRAEQTVANWLGAVGLFDEFNKRFKGDESFFDDAVMNVIKTQLPGQFIRFKTEQYTYKDKNKDDQVGVRVVGFGSMKAKVEELEAELFKAKESKAKDDKKGAKETKPAAVENDPFA